MNGIPPQKWTRSARLTVVETVYHQQQDGEATNHPSRFERVLVADEQPYQRRLKVGAAWQILDTGWVGEVGMLVVEAEGGPVVLSFDGMEPDVSIPAGESARFTPARRVFIRCPLGDARIRIFVVPS